MNAGMDTLMKGLDERLARGVVAGLAAGLLFLLANMWYADSQGLPAVAPLFDISTIFYFTDKPDPVPVNAAVGLVVHLTLSAAFGVLFAIAAPMFSSARMLAIATVVFGLALYVVNFQILGRIAFEWFQEGPNQTFEVFAHAGYGLLLAPFLLGYAGAAERSEVAVERVQPQGADL
ncbi:MAG: hypothetical protein AB7T48_00390 [Solirubrobacterales bacterium]